MTEGGRLLGLALQERGETISRAALRLKVARAQIHRWMHDGQVPQISAAVTIRDEYGIPMDSWDRAAQQPEQQTAA